MLTLNDVAKRFENGFIALDQIDLSCRREKSLL